jgi:hypothetical protein
VIFVRPLQYPQCAAAAEATQARSMVWYEDVQQEITGDMMKLLGYSQKTFAK